MRLVHPFQLAYPYLFILHEESYLEFPVSKIVHIQINENPVFLLRK